MLEVKEKEFCDANFHECFLLASVKQQLFCHAA
jgi:hypothetical protein